jgi:hypothetical protein
MPEEITTLNKPALEMDPVDVTALAYIHSNKFITTKLFHKKFHSGQSYVTACVHLRGLVSRGLLLKTQNLPNEDTYYYLSRPALRLLSGLARILISAEVRSPRINTFEREHDRRLLEMRIHFEANPILEGLTWLSDYEMRCGLKMSWKKALEEGRGWELAGTKLQRLNRRTPDGYFKATLEGQAYTFVLEYEHSPYNREQMGAMVLNLNRDFPQALRLVVSRDKEQAIRLLEGLASYLKGDPRQKDLWGFSFFGKVASLPFIRVPWVNLEGEYLPFVKDPILKAAPKGEEKPQGGTHEL